MIQLHIERSPEGVYLATSNEVQSGTAATALPPAREAFDYPLIVAT